MNLSSIVAPDRLYSLAVGWGARRTVPRSLRGPIYTAFARAVGARLDEVAGPLDAYPTFGAFFARRLRAQARPLAGGDDVAVSPCDGLVTAAGRATDGRLVQAKGRRYALADLLADREVAAAVAGGAYATIYLSPRDYHRVHAPCDVELEGYTHVPGARLPVSPRWADCVPNLYARNERLVLRLRSAAGTIAIVLVGAAAVGHLVVVAGDREQVAAGSVQCTPPIACRRGDELAYFGLGSTVVVVFPPGAAELCVRAGDRIRFGEALARLRAERRREAS